MSYLQFNDRWKSVNTESRQDTDEQSLYVPEGAEPKTQRQFDTLQCSLFVLDRLRESNAQTVIEVGAGRGTLSLYIAQRLCCAVSVLDNQEEAIAIARSEFSRYGGQATFYTRDVLETGLDDNAYDAAVSLGLAEHFESLDELFREQYRILTPGGIMVSLNIPKKFSIQFLNTAMRAAKKMFGAYRDPVRKDYYRNDFSAREYERAAHRVGFRRTDVVHIGPFPLFTPVSIRTDRRMMALHKKLLTVRGLFLRNPYNTNSVIAQAHFLVGYKD